MLLFYFSSNVIFSCDQAALWLVQSARLSVRPSVRHTFFTMSGNSKFEWKSAIFVPCDLEIQQMTLENNRAPHLTYFKLFAFFHSHRSIQTVVTVRKRQIRIKIGNFLPRDLEILHMTLKTIVHLFLNWLMASKWCKKLLHRRGALLFFKVICQISRSHGAKNCPFWPELSISGL